MNTSRNRNNNRYAAQPDSRDDKRYNRPSGSRYNNQYASRNSGKGLKVGVFIAIIIVALLAIALFATIIISNNREPSLQGGTGFFGIGASEEQQQQASNSTYTISLDTSAYPGAVLQNGTNTVAFELGTSVDYLPFATLDGMRFVGWFTGAESDPGATKIDNNSLELLSSDVDQTLYARFETRPTSIDYDNPGLPILMYHYFYNPEVGEVGEDGNWLDIRLFREHLIFFTSRNYYFPTWEEVIAYIKGEILLPVPSVVLTADDGFPQFFDQAAPLVIEYGAKMTSFYVLIDLYPPRLEQYDPKSIFVQSHSYDMHRSGYDGDARLLTASREEIFDDVNQGREILGNSLAYCLPFGKTNENARTAMYDAGVGIALAINNERAYPLCDLMEVPRLRISDGCSVEYLASVAY